MKRNNYRMFAISILLFLVVAFILVWTHLDGKRDELEYVYDESTFHNFSIDESGYVAFDCDITVRNNSNAEMKFTMKANVSKDIGLTKESFAYAYEGNSQNHELFDIAPKSKQTYKVKFKALSGDKKTKADRHPPKEIILTLQ